VFFCMDWRERIREENPISQYWRCRDDDKAVTAGLKMEGVKMRKRRRYDCGTY
jgi:hypothetical protein